MLQKTILAAMKEATSHLLELVPRDPYASSRPSFLIRSVFLDRLTTAFPFPLKNSRTASINSWMTAITYLTFPKGTGRN